MADLYPSSTKKKLPLIKFREIQKQEKKAPEIKILMTF